MTEFVRFFEDLRKKQGESLGVTEWFTIDQVKNDLFCHITRDRQRSYNDPDWAGSRSPKESTIVNPLFTLALHAAQSLERGIPVRTTEEVTAFNYGYDSVVWNEPVPVDTPMRARIIVTSVEEPRPGHYLAKVRVEYEAKGQDHPVVVADTALYCLPPDEVEAVKAG